MAARASQEVKCSRKRDDGGADLFARPCPLELDGIVSKRCDLPYRSGRSVSSLKIKNPAYERPRAAPSFHTGKLFKKAGHASRRSIDVV
jgi:ATP-dependent DNA ligase